MWWEPRSEREFTLQQSVLGMAAVYRELRSRAEGTPIRGIGAGRAQPVTGRLVSGRGGRTSELSLLEDWRPLVLVDVAAVTADARSVRVPWEPVAETVTDLYALEPSPGTLVEAVGPIAPAVRPGNPVTSPSAGVATIGLPVVLNARQPNGDSEGFLTVAHGTPTSGPVTVTSVGGAAISGSVAYRDISADSGGSSGGDDIALVTLPAGSLAGLVPNSGVLSPPPGPPYAAMPCDLHAGQSGHVLAQVNGALLQLGDSTWQWGDCWELGGTTPGMRPGDSGALAVGPTAPYPIFGHFVGGSVNLRGPGFTHHWVQDLGRVLTRHPGLAAMITY
jgi:hypothetical protein